MLKLEGDSPVYAIHLYGWGGEFSEEEKAVLELPYAVVLGVNIGENVRKLRARFRVNIKRMKELRRYAKHDNPNKNKRVCQPWHSSTAA